MSVAEGRTLVIPTPLALSEQFRHDTTSSYPDRHDIERFHRRVDRQAQDLKRRGYAIKRDGAPSDEVAAWLRKKSEPVKDTVNEFISRNSLADELGSLAAARLLIFSETLEHRLIWPIAATYSPLSSGAERIRRDLSASMFVTVARLINSLLDIDGGDDQTGLLNELTPLALLNMTDPAEPHRLDSIALPGTFAEDAFRKIDLTHLTYGDTVPRVQKQLIQAKSGCRPKTQTVQHCRAQGIHIVTAHHTKNTEVTAEGLPFPTSRAIVAVAAGTATPEQEQRARDAANNPVFARIKYPEAA